MADNMYRVGIGAESASFENAMKRMEDSVSRVTSAMETKLAAASERGFGRLEKKIGAVVKGLGAYISYRAIEDVTTAALKQERAIGEVAAAYQSWGMYSDELMNRTLGLANEMQKVANVEDEVVESGIALMTNIGKLSGDQIPAATRAAIGMASAYKMDVTTAFNLVGRAAAGNTQMMARYGIVLGEGLSPQEKFNALLEKGARWFEIAKANAGDSLGRFQQLGIQLGELKEALGGLATTPFVISGIEVVTYAVRQLTDYIGNMGISLTLIGTEFEKMAAKASAGLTQAGLAAGQIPGAGRAGITPESIQKSLDERLAAIDRKALDAVNAWEAKQNARMKALGNRPIAPAAGGGEVETGGKYQDWRRERAEEILKSYIPGERAFAPIMPQIGAPVGFKGRYEADVGFNVETPKLPGKWGFEMPALGMNAGNWLEIENQNREEDIERQKEHDDELLDIQARTADMRIRNTMTGYDQERALSETAYAAQRDDLVRRYGESSEAVKALEELHAEEIAGIGIRAAEETAQAWEGLGNRIADTMMYAMMESGNAMENIASAFKAMLTNMAAQMAAKAAVFGFLNFLSGGMFGGVTGGIGKFVLGNIFRAEGGPVEANRPYIVGERGPEVFVPGKAGRILPDHSPAPFFQEDRRQKTEDRISPAPLIKGGYAEPLINVNPIISAPAPMSAPGNVTNDNSNLTINFHITGEKVRELASVGDKRKLAQAMRELLHEGYLTKEDFRNVRS